VDRSDASALADLQMHWDEAYAIGLDGDIWSARFHGSAVDLRAHTSSELRELIRADYAYRQQVSRARAAASRADDDDLDDEDYAAHFDSAHLDSARLDSARLDSAHFDDAPPARPGIDAGIGHQDDAELRRQAGPGRASLARDSYANLRGERMST
jgi:hypothetical protein